VTSLGPKRRWQAITLATLVLVPAYWAILAGAATMANDGDGGIPNPAAAVAFGLALVPFVFVVLAFISAHPRAPGAVVQAMVLAVTVGAPVAAVAGDPVTGLVAGIGAGGVVALRLDEPATRRARCWAVAAAVLYTFVLVRIAALMALLPAPIFPFTAIGLADQLAERRQPAPTG
jgi:hypothetical protein